MSRITQFSTIGALMAGHLRAERSFASLCCGVPSAFGLGCSAEISGELTICDGRVYEATAGETLHELSAEEALPFVQVTSFSPQFSAPVEAITQDTAYDRLCVFIEPDNIFLAVCIEGVFEHLVLRRPYRADGGVRDVEQVAASQKIDRLGAIQGRLIGFWTPSLFGRVSVPGFHFHFLDEARQVSGHVLEFSAAQALMSAEEKSTIEIINPQSHAFRTCKIDTDKLDDMIHRIEK